MGSCVSVHKAPESAMRLRLSFGGSKNDKLVIPSPVKGKPVVTEADAAAAAALKSSQWTAAPHRDFGSKEEAFFDSQPWLESDCEDDFFSVNGDLTPSRGSTPVHHKFSMGSAQGNGNLFAGRPSDFESEPSPTDKKKMLSELFKESAESDQDVGEQNAVGNQKGDTAKTDSKNTSGEVPSLKSGNETPYVSGANSVCSSAKSPYGDFKPAGEKPTKSAQCCLPRLGSSRSFRERKKRMSPAPSVG